MPQGDVTVAGSRPRTSRKGASTANIRLASAAGTRIFNVADVAAGTDLMVEAPLIDAMGGPAALTKTGLGTLELSAANTYGRDDGQRRRDNAW